MKVQAFCVFDAAADLYMEPFFLRSRGEALRSFKDAVNKEGHPFAQHAADYTLFHIGEFDQEKGVMVPAEVATALGNALEYVVDGPSLLREAN